MRRINHWEQLLGLSIDKVQTYEDALSVDIWLDGMSALLELEPANRNDPFTIRFYRHGSLCTYKDKILPEQIVGKTISAIIVPFVDEGENFETKIEIIFDDRSGVYIATEEFTQIRLS